MRTGTLFVSAIAVCAAFVHTPTVHADEATVAYPEGYRSWTFLHGSIVPGAFGAFSKSPCVKPCTNGMFYFYANELAMKGLRTGAYDDGAIIAEEMLEFKIGEKGVGGEGRRVLASVMVMDRRRYASTGGWGFGNFDEPSSSATSSLGPPVDSGQVRTPLKMASTGGKRRSPDVRIIDRTRPERCGWRLSGSTNGEGQDAKGINRSGMFSRPRWWNQYPEQTLAQRMDFGPRPRNYGRLAGEAEKLATLLRNARVPEAKPLPCGGAMAISRPSLRRSCALLVSPLSRTFCTMTSAVVAVLISDPEKEIPLGAEKRFEKQFGLTPTEAKIAAALAGGKSVEAAAEHFSIRVATVRTHVRKILLKTNTVRRTYASPIERSVFV